MPISTRAASQRGRRKKPQDRSGRCAQSYDDLVELGKHLSFTERRADDAERELRQVKILELLSNHIGEEFPGVVTGITNFGIFIQLQTYLIDGLIRYEDLMDDWWDVDEKSRRRPRPAHGPTHRHRRCRQDDHRESRPAAAQTGYGDHAASAAKAKPLSTIRRRSPGLPDRKESHTARARAISPRRKVASGR